MNRVTQKARRVLNQFHTLINVGISQASLPLNFRSSQIRSYPNARDLKDFLKRNYKTRNSEASTRSLDIGCGNFIQNPFGASELFGIDVRENAEKNIIAADLNVEAIPFEDKFFDYVTAFDFLEHVPRVSCETRTRFPFVELMSEVNRVLNVGGLFFSHTPAYPSKQVFQDPTHVNLITEDTLPLYFCSDQPKAEMYGFKGKFELVAQEWSDAWLLTIMRKI